VSLEVRRALDFASIVFVVFALVPSGARPLELTALATLLLAAHVVVRWPDRAVSFLCLLATQALSSMLALPAHQLGRSWTAIRADFALLFARRGSRSFG